MSVCTFGTTELANVAAAICNAEPRAFKTTDTIHRVCDQLALISQANHACYEAKYGKGEFTNFSPASTAQEIEKAMRTVERGGLFMVADLDQAISTAGLFHYNCDDDQGDFTLKIEGAAAALHSILGKLLYAVAAKAGLR